MYIMCQEDTEKGNIICYNIFRKKKIHSPQWSLSGVPHWYLKQFTLKEHKDSFFPSMWVFLCPSSHKIEMLCHTMYSQFTRCYIIHDCAMAFRDLSLLRSNGLVRTNMGIYGHKYVYHSASRTGNYTFDVVFWSRVRVVERVILLCEIGMCNFQRGQA